MRAGNGLGGRRAPLARAPRRASRLRRRRARGARRAAVLAGRGGGCSREAVWRLRLLAAADGGGRLCAYPQLRVALAAVEGQGRRGLGPASWPPALALVRAWARRTAHRLGKPGGTRPRHEGGADRPSAPPPLVPVACTCLGRRRGNAGSFARRRVARPGVGARLRAEGGDGLGRSGASPRLRVMRKPGPTGLHVRRAPRVSR